jgi:predicted amidohydrolase
MFKWAVLMDQSSNVGNNGVMKVAGIQHDISWENPVTTIKSVAPMVRTAAAGGARLVVLSEMYGCGFSMAPERVAEAPDGPSATFIVDAAAQHDVYVCGSIPTLDPSLERPVNRMVVASPQGIVGTYDKIHPFTLGGEHEHYAPGTAPLTVEIEGVRASFFICYDLRFADHFWALAEQTDLYVVAANWPAKRRLHWQSLLRARAIENLGYVLGVNRVGADGNGVAHSGDSVLHSPLGETLASAAQIETVMFGEVDPSEVAGARSQFGFLNDR